MNQINMRELYKILNGTSLDIINPDHLGEYEAFTKEHLYTVGINGRYVIDSIRMYDYRYEDGGTHIGISIYNEEHRRTMEHFHYPKDKFFKSAGMWNVNKIDLIRMIFEYEVRTNA